MAWGRRGAGLGLNAPKVVTFVVSLALVLVAVAAGYGHIPAIGPFVVQHRFWIVVAGYVVLALGVILPGL